MALSGEEVAALLAFEAANNDLGEAQRSLAALLLQIRVLVTQFPELIDYQALKAQFGPEAGDHVNLIQQEANELLQALQGLPR